MQCPKCLSHIEGLDEKGKCPICREVITERMIEKQEKKEEISWNNARKLHVCACIQLALSIIGAIAIWINFGTVEVTKRYTYTYGIYTEDELNIWGASAGIAVIFFGFMWYYLFETIIDIYNQNANVKR